MMRASLLLLAACSIGPSMPGTAGGPAITDPGDTGGDDTEDSGEPPRTCADTPWEQLSASAEITCGTHVDGCVECWGHPGFGGEFDGCLTGDTGCVSFQNFHEDLVEVSQAMMVAVAPLGPYGGDYDTTRVCTLGSEGKVSCWGFQWEGPMEPVYRPEVVGIAASRGTVCGLTGADGAETRVECWDPSGGVPFDVDAARGARDIRAAGDWSICWNTESLGGCYNPWFDPNHPDRAFRVLGPADEGAGVLDVDVTIFEDLCTLDSRGAMRCVDVAGHELPSGAWPYPVGNEPMAEVCFPTSADFSGCALDERGSPFCWNDWSVPGIDATPATTLGRPLHGLTCGMYHACALTDDGEAVCWGDNSAGQAAPPGGYVLTSGTQTLWHHDW